MVHFDFKHHAADFALGWTFPGKRPLNHKIPIISNEKAIACWVTALFLEKTVVLGRKNDFQDFSSTLRTLGIEFQELFLSEWPRRRAEADREDDREFCILVQIGLY